MVQLYINILLICGSALGANILVLQPLPLFSHFNSFAPIFEALATRGHNVTLVSVFNLKKSYPNVQYIPVKSIFEDLDQNAISQIIDKGHSFLVRPFFFYKAYNLTKEMLKQPPLVQLIQDEGSHFDLIILETFFIQESLVAFGYKFNAPVLNLISSAPGVLASYLTGTPYPYSYVPNEWLAESHHMTFTQRLKNTLWSSIDLIIGLYIYLPQLDALVKETFKFPGSENMPSVTTMMKDTSLSLVNHHFSLGYPRPYHSNIVEIGGIQTEEKNPQIPSDMLKFIEGSKEGIIYFSTGSWLNSTHLKPEMLKTFQAGFSKLKQGVLWKWNGPAMDEKPANIFTSAWFPQKAILAHKKCKAFLTHGGINSLTEAMAEGVPVVGMSIMGEQAHNLKVFEEKGMGLTLNVNNLTAENIFRALSTVIDNPSFKEKAEYHSLLYKDRPMLIRDNAMYWIEYVIKHKGAHHLKPASLGISWCQYLLLDVVAVLLFAIALTCYTIFTVCQMCCQLCKKTKSPTRRSSKIKKIQ